MVEETLLAESGFYLREVLGDRAVGETWGTPWPEASQLPAYLQHQYRFYCGALFGHSCLLMLSRTPEGETPAVVRKHWQVVSQQFNGDVIYLLAVVSSYNRKRLIEQQVPFLVPGNQLYLPTLGVDLREYFKPGRQAERVCLSAAAQVIVLREILYRDCSGQPAKDLAQQLGYSPMTITRAIKELEDRRLASVEKVGREKHLQFSPRGRALWEAALPVLQSPVKKRVWCVLQDGEYWKTTLKGHIAGEAALAHYTSLADSGVSRWAINAADWPAVAQRADIQVLASSAIDEHNPFRYESEVTEVELWLYNPRMVALDNPCVDPLSLWLSLGNNTDERMEIAQESLLEQVWRQSPW